MTPDLKLVVLDSVILIVGGITYRLSHFDSLYSRVLFHSEVLYGCLQHVYWSKY